MRCRAETVGGEKENVARLAVLEVAERKGEFGVFSTVLFFDVGRFWGGGYEAGGGLEVEAAGVTEAESGFVGVG